VAEIDVNIPKLVVARTVTDDFVSKLRAKMARKLDEWRVTARNRPSHCGAK
jgi:hypothetical protein